MISTDDGPSNEINAKVTERDDLEFAGSDGSSQYGSNSSNEFTQSKWLRDIICCTNFKVAQLVATVNPW